MGLKFNWGVLHAEIPFKSEKRCLNRVSEKMSELFAVVGHFLRPLSYSILCKSADFKMP